MTQLRWILGVVAACAGFSVVRFAGPEFVLDDAFITLRSARTWIEQGVPATQVGAADANTSVVWLALARLALELELDALSVLRFLGAACHVLTSVVIAAAAACWVVPRSARRAALGAGLASALSGSLAFHAASGLETGLWSLSVAVVLYGLSRFELGVLLLGVTLTAAVRPEGALFAALICGLVGVRDRRWAALTLLGALLGASSVTLFRFHYFGTLLPNTAFAKPPDLAEGIAYLLSFALWGLGGLMPLAMVPALARFGSARALCAVALVMASGTAATGGDWMPGYRRFTACYLCLVLVAGVGVGLSRKLAPWLGVVFGLTAHAAAYASQRDHGRYNPESMPFVAQLVTRSPELDEVALVDIGAFGWHYRGRIYDVAGLSDAQIARRPGGHLEKWDDTAFRARQPDLALAELNPADPQQPPFQGGFRVRSRAEACLIGSALELGYRPVTTVRTARNIYLLVLLRPDRSLSRQIWGEPLPIDVADLRAHFPPCAR